MAGVEVGLGLRKAEGTGWTEGHRNGWRYIKNLRYVFSRTWKLGKSGSAWRAGRQSGCGEKRVRIYLDGLN